MSSGDPASESPQPERRADGSTDARWIAGLEPGPLRDSLLAQHQSQQQADTTQAVDPSRRATFVFDGTGAEYFRIWAVNLLLTLLTLGVYSAWAKVRKARWFAQHTVLLGDRFDYHAEPLRLLVGRVLALGLLLLWIGSFAMSTTLGLVTLALVCAFGPLLFASAQRFKLANTSWRGLRFGYDVPVRRLYVVCVPLLLLWAIDRVGEAFGLSDRGQTWLWMLALLTLPWALARLTHLQRTHARFGRVRFQFKPVTQDIYEVYAKSLGLAVAAVALVSLAMLVYALVTTAGDPKGYPISHSVSALVCFVVVWIFVNPYIDARIHQLVWQSTALGPVRFESTMHPDDRRALVLRQVFRVLITGGVYWPFAAVALARYNVESLCAITDDGPIADLRLEGPPSPSGQAVGDGVADAFGLDLGW